MIGIADARVVGEAFHGADHEQRPLMDLGRSLDDLDGGCGARDVMQVGTPAEQRRYQVVSDLSGMGPAVGLDLQFEVAQAVRGVDVDRGCLLSAGAVVQVDADVVDVGPCPAARWRPAGSR